MDQSSGHGRMQDGVLNANTMSVRYGGKQSKLRKPVIKDVGTYNERLLNSLKHPCTSGTDLQDKQSM